MTNEEISPKSPALKGVLLLGATGAFGRRLAERLSDVSGIEVVLASRHLNAVKSLAASLSRPGKTPFKAEAIDHQQDFATALAEIKPWAVLDCSGPFQGSDFATAKSAIAAGCHFIDLADARDHLLGFAEALHDEARHKGVVALSGASSTPCLSSAVVAELTEGWQRIDTIDMAITPDGHNQIGLAVAQGSLSYAGKPVPIFRYGHPAQEQGWVASRKLVVLGVGTRTVATAETVDAELLPTLFKVQSRVRFSAGLESRLEQGGLKVLGRLRQWGLAGNLLPLARPLVTASNVLRRFGGKRGGMVVRVTGINDEGAWTEATWNLFAENAQGPYVPILPMVAALRQLLAGTLPVGARTAACALPLSTISAEFAGLAISTQSRVQTRRDSLFDTVLAGESCAQLPPAISRFHNTRGEPVWEGRASVRRGRNLIARMISAVIGLPAAAEDAAVRVTVEREPDSRERWTRDFGGQFFHSEMSANAEGKLVERFGPVQFQLGLAATPKGTSMPVERGWLLGLPLPGFLLPRSEARETVDAQGRFHFDVAITLPLIGLLAHYRGWLLPKTAA